MRILPPSLVALVALGLSPIARAEGEAAEVAPLVAVPSPLRLAQATDLLLRHGLDLLIADSAIESAHGDLAGAGAVPNPALAASYGIAFTPEGSCTGCAPPGVGLGLSDQNALEDSLSGKRGLRIDVATAALAAARMSRKDAERNLLFQVKQQFVQVVLAQGALEFAHQALDASTRMFDLSSIRYHAGAISEADLARIETAKLEAEQAVNAAEQNLRTTQVGLAFLVGVRGPVNRFVVVGEDYEHYALPTSLQKAGAGPLLARALELRPDLRAQKFQEGRSESALRLAKRLRFPDIAASVQYAQNGFTGPTFSAPTATFGISITLPVFYQQQGEIQRASADRHTQALQSARLQAQVASDVESAFAGFEASRKQVQRMEARLLERSKRARDLVAIQYAKGAASLLEYLDAQRTYIAVNVEYFQDVANYWTSVFKLEQATGMEFK